MPAVFRGEPGRGIAIGKIALKETKAEMEVVARWRLCRWNGGQAGFLEEVTHGRALRQVVTMS